MHKYANQNMQKYANNIQNMHVSMLMQVSMTLYVDAYFVYVCTPFGFGFKFGPFTQPKTVLKQIKEWGCHTGSNNLGMTLADPIMLFYHALCISSHAPIRVHAGCLWFICNFTPHTLLQLVVRKCICVLSLTLWSCGTLSTAMMHSTSPTSL